MPRTGSLLILCMLGLAADAGAQQRAPELGPELLLQPTVRSALSAARAAEQQTIDDQIRICEIEAPPFQEARRAQFYAQLLRGAGLKNVRIDTEVMSSASDPGPGPPESRRRRPPRHGLSPGPM